MNVACLKEEKTFQVSSYRVRNELAVSATLFSSYMHTHTHIYIYSHDKNTHDNKTSSPSHPQLLFIYALLEFIVH